MTQLHRRFDFLSRRARRGVSLLWIIIAFPALVLFLVFAVEIGNIWLARVELEQSLEANALAAVKQWAEGETLDTNAARMIGNDFSIANPVRGVAVDLTLDSLNPAFDGTLNYNTTKVNDNAVTWDVSEDSSNPSGVMVFGEVVIPDAPLPGDESVIFDTTVVPSCGFGEAALVVDATSSMALGAGGVDNDWGISFLSSSDPDLNANLRIYRIEIDLEPGGGTDHQFIDHDSASTEAILADNSGQKISSGPGQADNSFIGSAPPINFSLSDNDTTLVIDFDPDGAVGGFTGLAPGERFRFSAAAVNNVMIRTTADIVGLISTQVRVYYSFSGSPLGGSPYVSSMINNTDSELDCGLSYLTHVDDLGQTHIVEHPTETIDLPCPPGDGGGNGQSFVQIESPISNREYYHGVRVQGAIEVPSVVTSISGVAIGPWFISGKATAYYDCNTNDAKLIRIDRFISD